MNEKMQHDTGRYHNLAHTIVILSAMGALFSLLGWMVFGYIGVAWALAMALMLLATTPRISPPMILRMYGAQPLEFAEAPGLNHMVSELSRRADLPNVPRLYYVPSMVLNAFSVGTSRSSAIALSDGLIRYLTSREIAGVLAHEVSHIRNNDLKLHALADMMTRVTSLLSFFGQILIIIYIPMAFFSNARIPYFFILLLVFAPTLSVLLQLALSRNREFVADATAVRFTHDPEGLASALKKMDRYEKNTWEVLVLPGKNDPHPSLLRTHPHTNERIERLLRLEGKREGLFDGNGPGSMIPGNLPEVKREPRVHWFRPWY